MPIGTPFCPFMPSLKCGSDRRSSLWLLAHHRSEAMNTNDKPNLDKLSLKPIDPSEPTPSDRGKARFQIEMRGGSDQRAGGVNRAPLREERNP